MVMATGHLFNFIMYFSWAGILITPAVKNGKKYYKNDKVIIKLQKLANDFVDIK